MVNGISANSSIDWLTLLGASKKQSSEKTGNSQGFAMDTADLSRGAAGRHNPLEQLVNDGTITSEQASAIDEALRSAMQSGQAPGSGEDPLADLISSGIITQDQADSVKSALDASRPSRPPQGDGFMSNVLDNLVSSGTITQDQADSVEQALIQDSGRMPPPPPPDAASSSGSTNSTDLSSLTEDEILQLLLSGQISSQQAVEALRDLESDDSAETVSSVSSAKSSGPANPLDKLLENGTITKEQEDAIQSAFKQAMDAGKAAKAYGMGSSTTGSYL